MKVGEGVTVRELVARGAEALKQVSETARLDAEILVSHVLGFSKADLIREGNLPVSPADITRIEALLDRRKLREPVAYLVGRKGFWAGEFRVSPAVLVPRPETELLVEEVCERMASFPTPKILDLGTGSGCIAISVATTLFERGARPRVVAVDASDDALRVAALNAEDAEVAPVVEFRRGDWFSSVQEFEGLFDCIVTNPPYVPEGDPNMSPETKYEPEQALFAGPDGLDDLRVILRESGRFLKSGGYLVCEFGMGQDAQLREIAKTSASWGNLVTIRPDLAGIPRALVLQKI